MSGVVLGHRVDLGNAAMMQLRGIDPAPVLGRADALRQNGEDRADRRG